MTKLIILFTIIIASVFGLSYYKNKTISKEFSKQLSTMKNLEYKDIKCDGFLKSDCSISNPKFKGVLIADELIVSDIDPTIMPKQGEFLEIPLRIDLKNTKFSIWDALSKQESSPQMQKFLKKYSGDYDISSSLTLLSDGYSVKSLKILDLKADDKFLPFDLSGEVDGLDGAVILKDLDATFDFSKKRVMFNDFVDSMKECCVDDFPDRYKMMSKDELYSEFKENIKDIDLQIESLNDAISVLSDDKKHILHLSIKGKSDTPISKMLLPFLMGGTRVVDQFFDISVEAK
jgi:hypothetical protein